MYITQQKIVISLDDRQYGINQISIKQQRIVFRWVYWNRVTQVSHTEVLIHTIMDDHNP